MSKKNQFNSFVLILLFFTILLEGCVSKSKFLAKADENKTLARQLQDQHQKTEDLEKEKTFLKKRLDDINRQAGLREKEQTNLIKAQAEQIDLLEQQRRQEEAKKNDLEKEKNLLNARLNTVNRQAGLREKEQTRLIKAQTKQIGLLEQQQREEKAGKDRLASDKQSLEQAIRQLKERLSGEKRQTATLSDRLNATSKKSLDLEKMLAEAEKLAEKKIRDAQESLRAREDLIKSLNKEIQEGHVKISQMNDQLSVQILSKILFPSGSDHVTEEGKMVLTKVSGSLKNIQDNKIRIEGHTDNVPIGPGLSHKFPSNWELSTARATQVVRLLAKEQVNPDKLMAVGMAEYTPVASNDTPEGRQKNRRIEIILSPK
ncbi:MAG: OmpA family protein [Nitrospiria bacterium]